MPIFSAENNHTKTGDTPPIITNSDPNVYIGYFQNEHGEQWVFTFDRSKRVGELQGGDASWKPIPVIGVGGGAYAQIKLNAAEEMWLEACWKAATVAGRR